MTATRPRQSVVHKKYVARTIPVLTDTASLIAATGFWSGSSVHCNASSKIILLDDSFDLESLRKLAHETYSENLRPTLKLRIEEYSRRSKSSILEMLKSDRVFRSAFNARDLACDSDLPFKNHLGVGMWSLVSDWLNNSFDSEERHKEQLIDLIHSRLLAGGCPVGRMETLSVPFLQLANALVSDVLEYPESILQKLADFAVLGQFQWNMKRDDQDAVRRENDVCIRVFNKYGAAFTRFKTETDVKKGIAIAGAAGLLLAVCAHKKLLLLPTTPALFGCYASKLAPEWPWERINPTSTQLLQAILTSTTVRSITELPGEPRSWLSDARFDKSFNYLFLPLLEEHARSNPGLAAWPLANLHKQRAKAMTVNASPWHPSQILNRYGSAWGRFAEILDSRSDASTRERDAALRHLIPWAGVRGFRGPCDISPRDLLDPHNFSRPDTYKSYLEVETGRGEIFDRTTGGTYWAASARSYDLVVNQLKIDPEDILPLQTSPFSPHTNPFPRTSRTKTTRNRLPNHLHEAMLEVLLEPDETGRPTYQWALEACPDEFDTHDPTSGVTMSVLCPSRPGLLGLLLSLPVRSRQGRWLDRGLLDAFRWDWEAASYQRNTHSLAGWRYPNGSTQEKFYGRPTGLFQPMTDAVGGTPELGIYVNTNKTQMWDPERIRGYDLPWPYVRDDEIGVDGTETATWLNRPYNILRAQMQWMDAHLPNPVPISFADSSTDRVTVNDKKYGKLPVFCPVFADLSSRSFRANETHDSIYLPVGKSKLYRLFNALCVETERRMLAEGRKVLLTTDSESKRAYEGRVSIFDIHSLRVSGIPRLVELGVPISIVQEFVVGHATAVMTSRYNLVDINLARKELRDKLGDKSALVDWRLIAPAIAARPEIWALNKRWSGYRDGLAKAHYSGWIGVPGGVCPLGGTACDVGGVDEGDSESAVEARFIPVIGGCGNCRIFSTGPMFLVQQAQVMNELMLELRLHGGKRRELSNDISELSWSDTPDLNAVEHQRLQRKLLECREQLTDIDKKLEPLILEWFNRYVLFEDSKKKITMLRELKDSPSVEASDSAIVLIAGIESAALAELIQVQLEKAGEFTLVRSILDIASVQGGIRRSSKLARDTCAQFMDRILRAQGSSSLLMDIGDEKLRHDAAYLMACGANKMFGAERIDSFILNADEIGVDGLETVRFLEWAKDILNSKPLFSSVLEPIPAGVAINPSKSK